MLNGGQRSHTTALEQLGAGPDAGERAGPGIAGVMVGREAYENPWMLAEVDRLYFGAPASPRSREDVVATMRDYLDREAEAGTPPRAIVRHMLGLFNGLPGARRWRRTLSDSETLAREGERVLEAALAACRLPLAA